MHGLGDSWALGVRALLSLTLIAACGGSTPLNPSTDGSSGSSTNSTGPVATTPGTGVDTTAGVQTSDGTGSTGAVDTTAGVSTGSSSGPPPSTSTGPDPSTDSGGSSSSGGGMPFMCPPGGGMACTDPLDCASNACFVVGPLGGVCSECDEDADCAWGCHPGNPLSGECARCCDGSIGCGCESGLACQAGLYCTPIISIPGIINQSSCSECAIDADCAGGDLCSPSYDFMALAGQHDCVAPGSQANGDGCDGSGSGDLQCASGNCAAALLMGIPVADICSECDEDADCPGAATCTPPEFLIVGMAIQILPGFCA